METIKQNINITGNRILFILSLLINNPLSKEEIIKEIVNNSTLKNVSPDTITLDINTLRAAGFAIESSKIDYKYSLGCMPIKIKLAKSEISSLNRIKKSALELWDWKSILGLYKIFQKIAKYVDSEYQESLLNFSNFTYVDLDILSKLEQCVKNKDEVILEYNSPKGDDISIHAKCVDIKFDNKSQKLYLYSKLIGYKDITLLRIDKILDIKEILQTKSIDEADVCFSFYKLKKSALKTFQCLENEEITGFENDFALIKVKITNNFHFIQRLLNLGEDAIVEDSNIRKEILSNLLKTKEIYK